MPHFSQVSLDRLNTCHPLLRHLGHLMIRDQDFSILEGYRSPERQMELYDLGRTKVLKSKHNNKNALGHPESLAFDIAPYPIDFGLTTRQLLRSYVDTRMTAKSMALLSQRLTKNSKTLSRFYYLAGAVKDRASQLGIEIRWGGDWDSDEDFFDQTFDDLVHFELVSTQVSSQLGALL